MSSECSEASSGEAKNRYQEVMECLRNFPQTEVTLTNEGYQLIAKRWSDQDNHEGYEFRSPRTQGCFWMSSSLIRPDRINRYPALREFELPDDSQIVTFDVRTKDFDGDRHPLFWSRAFLKTSLEAYNKAGLNPQFSYAVWNLGSDSRARFVYYREQGFDPILAAQAVQNDFHFLEDEFPYVYGLVLSRGKETRRNEFKAFRTAKGDPDENLQYGESIHVLFSREAPPEEQPIFRYLNMRDPII